MSVIDDALRRAEEDGVRPSPLNDCACGGAGAQSREREGADSQNYSRRTFAHGHLANDRNSPCASAPPQAWSVAAPRRSTTALAATLVLAVVALVLLARPVGNGGQAAPPSNPPLTHAAPAAPDDSASREPAANTPAPVIAERPDAPPEPPRMGPTPQFRAQPAPASPTLDAPPEMRVATVDSPIAKRYQLEGVFLGGSSRMAVINGAIVEVGQSVDGAVVCEIDRRYVTIAIDGERLRLPLRAASGDRERK